MALLFFIQAIMELLTGLQSLHFFINHITAKEGLSLSIVHYGEQFSFILPFYVKLITPSLYYTEALGSFCGACLTLIFVCFLLYFPFKTSKSFSYWPLVQLECESTHLDLVSHNLILIKSILWAGCPDQNFTRATPFKGEIYCSAHFMRV